mgnify:CR=1 FL=1
MIYDAVHQAVLLHEGHKTQLLELAAPLELPPPSAREQQFQALWTQFYKTLEIKRATTKKAARPIAPNASGRIWWSCRGSCNYFSCASNALSTPLSRSSAGMPYSLASAIRLEVFGSEVPFSHLDTA